MKVLEKSMIGKNKPENCEDALVISSNFIAVIDGVTSKSPFRWQGKTTGKIASEIIKNVILDHQLETIDQIIALASYEIRQFNERYLGDIDQKRFGLQAVMAIYSQREKQVYLVGDCMAMIGGKQYQLPKKSDQVLAEFRSLVTNIQLIKSGQSDEEYFLQKDLGREIIFPWIVDSNLFANQAGEWAYAVLNGEDIPQTLIQKIEVGSGTEVILASDGYFELAENLEETEALLKQTLESNPYLYKIDKSTKGRVAGNRSFDDRTYVRFITE